MSSSGRKPGNHRVYVGPESDAVIVAAVEQHGATVVGDPADAEYLVWLSPSIPDLERALHPGIRWVQLKSAGIEHVLRSGIIDEARTWTCARGAYAEAVAEHGLTLMLAAARRLHEIIPDRRWGEPGSRFGRLFAGSTIGIIGCGSIGEALIRMMSPFGVRVIAVTRSGRTVEGADHSLSAAQSNRAIAEADFLVLSAPSTGETVGFMDRQRLERMRQSSWLVNIGRGDLVVTDDLVAVLSSGVLGGAALDVTDPQPLPDDHPLWQFESVIITPHTANPPEANSQTLAELVEENLQRLSRGDPLVGTIDPERGY